MRSSSCSTTARPKARSPSVPCSASASTPSARETSRWLKVVTIATSRRYDERPMVAMGLSPDARLSRRNRGGGIMLLFRRVAVVAVIAATIAAAGAGAPAAAPTATCTLPAGNAAQQWDTIAQTITVGATGFQIEAFVYMAYANYAAYRAVFAHGSAQSPFLVSPDAAIATAEADVLAYYFPSQSSLLSCYRDASLANVPDGLGKLLGTIEGHRAAVTMTLGRIGDGRLPIGTVETAYPPAGPGV